MEVKTRVVYSDLEKAAGRLELMLFMLENDEPVSLRLAIEYIIKAQLEIVKMVGVKMKIVKTET